MAGTAETAAAGGSGGARGGSAGALERASSGSRRPPHPQRHRRLRDRHLSDPANALHVVLRRQLAVPGDTTRSSGSTTTRTRWATRDFWSAVRRTAYFTFVSTGLELVLGLGIALLLNAPLRARWLFRTIVVLPWALPTIVNGAMWRYIFNAQYGVLNAMLTQVGLQNHYHAWLNSQTFALNAVIFADVWKNTSLVAFFLLAGPDDDPARSVRGGAGRRRERLAGVPAHHAADAEAGDRRRARAAHDRGLQGLRHHLRDDARRPGQRDAERRPLHLPAGVLQRAVRLRRRARVSDRACSSPPSRSSTCGRSEARTRRWGGER